MSSLGGHIPLDVHEPEINADFISFMFGNALRLLLYISCLVHTPGGRFFIVISDN